MLGTYQPGEFIFQCHIFFLFHTVHGVLKARILKWFTIPFSSGPHFFRTLHHDPSVLGGPTCMAHSFIELDKAVVHVLRLVSLLGLWFLSARPLMPLLSTNCLTRVSLILDVLLQCRKATTRCSSTLFLTLSSHGPPSICVVCVLIFSSYKMCMCACILSCFSPVQLFATVWTVSC